MRREMANKTWPYVVTYQDPTDAELPPSQRGEERVEVEATSAKRAISKALTVLVEEWEGVEAKDLMILDAYRKPKYGRVED